MEGQLTLSRLRQIAFEAVAVARWTACCENPNPNAVPYVSGRLHGAGFAGSAALRLQVASHDDWPCPWSSALRSLHIRVTGVQAVRLGVMRLPGDP